MEKQNYNLAIKLALVDLIYNMNRNTSLKLNFIVIAVQFIMLFISIILQLVVKENKLSVSIINALWSTAMLFIVIINTKIISAKAMKRAKEQRDMIEVLLDKLTKEENTSDESYE